MHAGSQMYLLDTKSSPSLTGQNNNRKMDSIGLNLLTKTTWKLKTPGGTIPVIKTCSWLGTQLKKSVNHLQ